MSPTSATAPAALRPPGRPPRHPRHRGAGHAKRVGTATLAVALAFATATGLTGCRSKHDKKATPPAAVITVGSVVDTETSDITSRLEGLLTDKALGQAAADRITLAVDNAVSSLGRGLDTALDRAPDTTRLTIDDLHAISEDLKAKKPETITDAADKAQRVMTRVSTTPSTPQVTSLAPATVPRKGSVTVTVTGAFAFAAKQQRAATLTVGTSTAEAIPTSETSVSFTLTAGTFASMNADTRVPVTVTIPHPAGGDWKGRLHPGRFTLSVTTAPRGATLASRLEAIRPRVASIATRAIADKDWPLTAAAEQVGLAVDDTASHYAAGLHKPLEELDDDLPARIDTLERLVARLTTSTTADPRTTAAEARAYVGALPQGENARVVSFGPKTALQGSNVQVTVDGSFTAAAKTAATATLAIGTGRFVSAPITASRITFTLPGAFVAQQQAGARIPATVTIAQPTAYAGTTLVPGRFTIGLTVLPGSPVKTTRATTTKTSVITQSVTRAVPQAGPAGGGWGMDSSSDCKDHRDTHTIMADAGWIIDPASIEIHRTRTSDRSRTWLSSQGPNGFTVNGETTANCVWSISYNSGSLTYYVTYTQYRTVTTPYQETLNVDASSWGTTSYLTVTPRDWRVTATLWDGSSIDTTTTDTHNPYLSVFDEGTRVRVVTVDPSTLAVP